MLGNFVYCSPTKLYFGKDSLQYLNQELPKYGPNVVLVYGGGSIKKNGIYDAVVELLKKNGKNVAEIAGVMPNPTLAKLYEGIKIARGHQTDLLLAVGGGSVCDYAKAVAVSVHCPEDPWDKYYLRFEEPDCPVVPVGCVLTMVGTGSEMNAGAVITNQETKQKIGHVFADEAIMPRFSILNPRFTLTLPHDQMVSGIYDIFNHICEQYFSGEDDNTSDYISEGLMRSVIHSSRIANQNPQDYEARSNIMWTATWALNTLVAKGKSTDWMVHMLGQAVGGYTNAAHGMTLSAVSLPYYRFLLPYGLPKFKRFAQNVWDVTPEGKSDQQIAEEGLAAMEAWMKELGLAMNLTQLGVTEDMLEILADLTLVLPGGYNPPNREEILRIFRESL
ncbi:iron-containing alcohol dehydrogenase [Evtepia sp.]|uniref:iron-containing alcohol dehydrogenase n=1 Tax=Evtepia sp. TaxID=2773933 RepID=UPI002A7F30F4|nr:iron-containing alcohol dehydrogenase [Evtepia sp.]MDY4430475.1 iron-containing alcohol dehydrogenase [Evtepia sp.]